MSLSQEARRTGFVGCTEGVMLSVRRGSTSSSELAKASESGVERRAFSFSSRIACGLGATVGKPPWPGLDCGPGLMVPELIVQNKLVIRPLHRSKSNALFPLPMVSSLTSFATTFLFVVRMSSEWRRMMATKQSSNDRQRLSIS